MLVNPQGKWKQPIGYFFTSGGASADQLAMRAREVMKAAQDCGINIVATVCDQASANMGAIRTLISTTQADHARRSVEYRGLGFEINHQDVQPLFDVPHLLKGLRNNMLQLDVKFRVDNQLMVASWKDYQRLYEMDTYPYGDRRSAGLTLEHVNPQKMRKMKVKLAAQVCSVKVSYALDWLSKTGKSIFIHGLEFVLLSLLFLRMRNTHYKRNQRVHHFYE
jgi:hypothetical protein